MRVHKCIFSATLLGVAILVQRAPTQESIVRVHDLRELSAPLPGAPGRFERPVLLLPVGPSLPVGEAGGGTDGGRVAFEPAAVPRIAPTALAECLAGLLGRELGGVAWQDEHQLVLDAPAGTQARVSDVLSVFAAVQARSVRLTCFELPAGAGADLGAVLAPEQVDALLRASPPVRATVATLHADVPWLWESGHSVRYVKDYEVEVAEKSNVADPKADAFFTGRRLGLCATPMPDGRILLRAGLHASAQVGALLERQLAGRGLGKLQVPVLQTLEVRTSAALPSGGGLLLAGDRDQVSWLLRLQPGATPPLQVAGAVALPLGHLAVAPMAEAREFDLVQRPGEGFANPFPDDRRPPDALAALEQVLGGALEVAPGHLRAFGSHVVLVDEPGLQARLEKALLREATALRTTTLAFRVGTVPNELALWHVTGQVRAEQLAAALPRGGVVATLPGHAFAVALWREQAFVRDYEVEIAAKASAPNPVVDSLFSGFALRGVVRANAAGEPQLTVHLQWGEVPAFEPLDLGNADFGEIDVPVTAWTEADGRLPLRAGEWQVAHLAPDPLAPETKSLVLMVRVE